MPKKANHKWAKTGTEVPPAHKIEGIRAISPAAMGQADRSCGDQVFRGAPITLLPESNALQPTNAYLARTVIPAPRTASTQMLYCGLLAHLPNL
jgi:hypothetical protein